METWKVCGPDCSLTTSKEKEAGGKVEGQAKTGKAVGQRGGRALSSEKAVGGSFTQDRVLASRGACCGPACSSTAIGSAACCRAKKQLAALLRRMEFWRAKEHLSARLAP